MSSRPKARSLDSHAIIEKLEALALAAGNTGAVAFDADGTLWSGDVGAEAFEHALALHAIRESARPALEREARVYAPGVSGSPTELARILYEAYQGGRYPEVRVCEMMVWCYAGWTEAEVREHTRCALRLGAARVEPFAPVLELARWTRTRGLNAIVISASPKLVVEEAAAPLGFEREAIMAGSARVAAGRLEPELVGPIPYAEEKARSGRALLGNTPWLASFGDNAFDLEMLKAARLGVAVRPRQRLLELLDQVPGAVVLGDDVAVHET